MKKILCCNIFLLISITGVSQELSLEEIQERSHRNARHQFITLGSWALGSMAVSAPYISQFNGPERYFHQMNVIWNGVNLGIAAIAYWDIIRQEPVAGLSQAIKKQHQFEKVLLFNAGLDLAYVAGGLYMFERGGNKKKDQLRGFGKSVMLQGAFLFSYDLLFYLIQTKNAKALNGLVEKLSLGPTGFSIIIPLNG
jgi:hypothetical protein